MQLLLSESPNKSTKLTIWQQATTISLLLRDHTTYIWVQLFAHIPFVVNRAFNITPKGGNKPLTAKFLLEKVQLKLMMSHLQQLFTLHWYRRFRRNNDCSTYQHGRQMDFSMEWSKNFFPGGQQW